MTAAESQKQYTAADSSRTDTVLYWLMMDNWQRKTG